MDIGHSLLKSAREKGERAIRYMEENEVDQLRKEIGDHVEQLEELAGSIRKEHMTSEILKLRNILVEVQSLWVWESSPLLNFFPRNYLLHSYFHFLSIYRVLKNKTSIAKLHFSGSNFMKK